MALYRAYILSETPNVGTPSDKLYKRRSEKLIAYYSIVHKNRENLKLKDGGWCNYVGYNSIIVAIIYNVHTWYCTWYLVLQYFTSWHYQVLVQLYTMMNKLIVPSTNPYKNSNSLPIGARPHTSLS